jgi:uncharacterized protein YmfQ (DUF2313 family)
MNVPQSLPTGSTLEDEFAREIAHALGPAYQPADGTLAAAELRADGTGLALVYEDVETAIGQAFVNTATVMLAEWEQRLGLPTDLSLSDASRQAALTAKLRGIFGGTPQRILLAVRALAPEAVITENLATAVAAAEPRNVFLFAVTISAAHWADDRIRASLRAAIEQMKPAHTAANVVTKVGFLFDDADSLFDRDAFGV